MLTDRSRIARSLCSSLAIATALIVGASAAHGQTAPSGSFQGNGEFASGSGTITVGSGTTTINLATNDAVIDWTTFDTAIGGGPINFQPSGTTATFQRASDFSVLNRILPTDPSRAIQFNGNIIAQIQGTTATPGGTVYFYSPGGVIVGSTAVFNVGNLGLTSIAPAVVGGVFEQTGTNGEFVQFNGAVTPSSAVTIQAGAQITSSAVNGSYVALVAPVINQSGTIDVNGVAALVSADAATITFRPSGLFDIQVTSGTSGTGTTLFNNGTITGPAFSGTGAQHRIYAVAVPKNTAITLAIADGSDLGFAVAGAADVVGNAIVLSAGFDIVGGQRSSTPSAGGGSGQAGTLIGAIDATSTFDAASTGSVFVFANGQASNYASNLTIAGAIGNLFGNPNPAQVRVLGTGGSLSVGGNLSVTTLDPLVVAPGSGQTAMPFAAVDADSGGVLNVAGAVSVSNIRSALSPGAAVTSGQARISATGNAQILIGGNAVVSARVQGGIATGGSANASASTGGTINVGGVLRLRADGIGGSGANGTGGSASVSATGGGDVTAKELNMTAEGRGGNDTGGGAGNGTGGSTSITASGAGSTISIANGNTTGIAANNDLFFMAARGFGGQSNGGGSGVGGSALGGNVSISATNGATLNGPANLGSTGFNRIFARAFGGDANTGASAGGAATGGNINITVDNATFTSAELLPSSFAQAGSALPTATGTINGGNAIGGTRNITVRNGATMTTSFPGGGPGAQGGNATLSGRGGDASGGSASLVVDNATLTLNGRASVFSQNAPGSGGTTGNVTGGTAFGQVSNGGVVNVFDDTASANDDFSISANAFGAESPATPGTAQGTVTAGTATLLVQGGTIQGAGTVGVGAGAFAQSDQYAQGGTYRGGTASLQVQGGTISTPQVRITANADAAAVGAGLSGTGGSATGGTARLQLNGGTLTGNTLEVNAEAFGGAIGAAGSGNGGIATGGAALIQVGTGSNTLTFNTINLTADAEGGDVSGTAGDGGAGVGGIAQFSVIGGASLTVNASNTVIESDGLGGDALSLTGNGGGGNAGRAVLFVDGASATFNGNVSLSGDSGGGDGINGGTAFGDPENNNSRAVVVARSGSLTITGLTSLHAVASGGAGNLSGNGGNASGGFANVAANNLVSGGGFGTITLGNLDIDTGAQGGSATGTGNGGSAGAGRAHLFVNGGAITVGGNATLSGDAIGGDGVNGGNAISARTDFQPRALIGSFNGTIDVAGSTSLVASASGGSGRLGGTGGVAFAGQAAVDAQSPNGNSAIRLGSLDLEASALGGSGGAGASGQAGGTGGDAYGGPVSVFGNAGRGALTVSGNTLVSAGARGGTGGQGGNGGETAPGAAGGLGGRAFGGPLTVGTRSGVETPSNTGSATFGQVIGNANASGGAGGAGGLGTTQGTGGAGGAGFGGSAGILVRGSPATFGDVTLTAKGIGGNGGAGAVQGDGGDGYAGDGFVNVTQRFMRTERGSLTANNVNIISAGIGGTGATAGDTFYSAATGAESEFFVRQSDVTLANLSLTSSGALAPNFTTTILRVLNPMVSGIPVPASITVAAEPFDLAMADSTASIAGNFTLSTPGNMRVSLANSTLNVGSLTLSAGNFVLPATRPATLGTINVSGGLTISTLLDFIAYANFNVAGDGLFDADGSVLTGDLTFGGFLDLVALGSITTGNIQAGEFIDLEAGGTITTGQLTAGDYVEADSVGVLTVAGASAGIVNPSSNPQAEYFVGLSSQTSLTAGNLTARGSVAVGSPGSVAVGNVTTGSAGFGLLALAGTGLTTGSIDTTAASNGGQVYLANWSMVSLATGPDNFDVTPILAATPVAIAGPIAINGAVATGRFQAATTGAFTAQAIAAPAGFELAAGTDVTLGDLSSFTVTVASAQSLTLGAVTSTATAAQLAALGQTNGVTLTAANGALATGAISSNGSIDLIGAQSLTTGAVNVSDGSVEMDTNGALLTGAITSGQSQRLFAGTTATTGNLVAGTNPNSQFSVGVAAGGAVSVGTISASRDVGLLSQNAGVTAGNVVTGTSLGVLTRGPVSLGSVATGAAATNYLYIANASMAPLGGALGPNFNPAPIFAATPVATTGAINVGNVSTGNFIAATTGGAIIGPLGAPITGTISATNLVDLRTNGTLLLGSVNAQNIRLNTGALTGGALTGRDSLTINANGAVMLGNLSAGLTPSTAVIDRDVLVTSTGGPVTVGTVTAAEDVGLAAGGGVLTAGNITAGDDVLLLARDGVSVGSIGAGTADGRVFIGNTSLLALGTLVNRDPIFNATTVAPVAGAVTLGGPVTGTTLRAAATGDFTAANLTFGQSLRIDRAALAQVNGAWVAPTIGIASQRLQFGTSTSAMIGGSGTTSLTLRALASGRQAVLGGTTPGTGYSLTQSDFGRIRTNNLTLQVDPQGASSGTPDLEIRDLTLTGSAGGGLSTASITTTGSARVVGDLLLSQAGATDTLAVTASQKLEIVLPDGSIAITGAGGALAGRLTVSSNNLVAATLDLLSQVLADPDASGLVDAFKVPASTTSNLAGYIRADGVKLLSNANILLQNSGTVRDFAGVTTGGGGLIIGRITPAVSDSTGGTTGGSITTGGFSFTGMLASPNEVLMFQFRVDANSSITLRTYSYAGGTNAAGQAIPAGGFDPILALFDAAGALIGQNDDGGSNVPADSVTGLRFDTFFQPASPLVAGTYTVSVSQFSNFAIGPNLSNGFEAGETDFNGRTANFAFDVLGAASATGPGAQAPSGPLNVIGFGRQQTAVGTTTGNSFFAGIDFGTSGTNPLVYTEVSQFNTCLVVGGCGAPDVLQMDPVAALSSEITVVTNAALDESPVAPTADDSDEGEDGSSDQDDEDADSDEGSSPIAPPTPLISTRALDGDVTVVEPVSGAGNPALFGSAVNETTVQGEKP